MRWVRTEVDGRVVTARVEGDELVVVDAVSPLQAILSEPNETGRVMAMQDAILLSPLVPVRNVMCVGWNYLPHFEEGSAVLGDRELPDRPTFFTKTTTAVNAPFGGVPSHSAITSQLDYEAELGVVIGSEVRDLDETTALEAVAGYVVANDISARDLQKGHGGQWYKGKSLDGTCPVGPWLVDAADVPDPQALDISCSVNGDVVQSSNTRHMIFPVARLLAELSQGLTLLPGDLLLTGTPEGVGFSQDPPLFLRPGDSVESTVSEIGTIRNTIV